MGRGGRRGVCLGGSGLVGEILPVSVGEPRQRSDVELVGRRRGRSVQEAFAPVVEDVLAVVGAVEQRRRSPAQSAQVLDRFREEEIRVEDRIVVGVAERLHVFPRDRHVVVGAELRKLARVTLVVTEVRAVAVEYEEHLLRLVAFHGAAHLVQQLHVVARRADIDQVVGVAGEFVDHGALRRLVGDEPSLETGLVEQRREPLAAVEFGMFVGRNGREDQRHALVRGVALREHVAENDQVIDLRKAGIRLAVVTVQLPVHRTRGFADDVDVYLAPRCLGRARRTVGEILRGLLEIVGLAEFRGTQVYVV